MKQLLVLLLVSISLSAIGQDENMEPILKQYFLVILTKGPNRNQDSVTVQKIQEAHINNINRLHKEGKIDIAGPFADESDWRGVFILNVSTLDEAQNLLQTDEAIRSGRLTYIIHPWLAQKGATLR